MSSIILSSSEDTPMPSTTKSSKHSVKLIVKPDSEPICVTEWSSNGVPVKENKIEVGVRQSDENGKKMVLEAKDPSSQLTYAGEQYEPKYVKYMIAVVEGNKAYLRPCAYFKMKPQLDIPKRTSDLSNLSRKEQIDECNEKFGSKRSLKRIEQRKKFAINFGEDDYHDMKDKASKLSDETNASNNDDGKKSQNSKADSEIYSDSFLMPPRNPNPISVKEVYDVNDIIKQSVVSIVKTNYDLSSVAQYLNDHMVKMFASKAKDELSKVMCIYLDILIKLKGMRSTTLSKAGFQGIPGVESSELQSSIMEDYTVSTLRNKKMKPTLTEKCKDKIIIHGLILSLMLNNYKPLIISLLAQAFQTSTVKLRKLANVVGCHIDTNGDKSEKIFVFKLPLFALDSDRGMKRRKIR